MPQTTERTKELTLRVRDVDLYRDFHEGKASRCFSVTLPIGGTEQVLALEDITYMSEGRFVAKLITAEASFNDN